jgi:hypothetical protein
VDCSIDEVIQACQHAQSAGQPVITQVIRFVVDIAMLTDIETCRLPSTNGSLCHVPTRIAEIDRIIRRISIPIQLNGVLEINRPSIPRQESPLRRIIHPCADGGKARCRGNLKTATLNFSF